MADMDDIDEVKKAGKEFHTDIPQETNGFFLKGCSNYSWGMKNRLSQIFNPETGHTLMLAFDHGYFQGPTTGLERIDVNVMPLEPYCDTLMLTRGILRTLVPGTTQRAIALRATGGPSILRELSNENMAVDVEDAIRLNVSCLAVQVYIGGEYETQTVKNLTDWVNIGNRYGIPVMAVTAVGKDMARDARYFRLASRICAELGAHIVKTYYTDEDFNTITSSCPVPIVIAGGKKIPELDALKMGYNALKQGASGLDMGRNIFQSDNPVAMIQAARMVVHENATPEEAHAFYEELTQKNSSAAK
jgi:putative autoinducer-2 (AI-2) aldolase